MRRQDRRALWDVPIAQRNRLSCHGDAHLRTRVSIDTRPPWPATRPAHRVGRWTSPSRRTSRLRRRILISCHLLRQGQPPMRPPRTVVSEVIGQRDGLPIGQGHIVAFAGGEGMEGSRDVVGDPCMLSWPRWRASRRAEQRGPRRSGLASRGTCAHSAPHGAGSGSSVAWAASSATSAWTGGARQRHAHAREGHGRAQSSCITVSFVSGSDDRPSPHPASERPARTRGRADDRHRARSTPCLGRLNSMSALRASVPTRR